MKFRKKPVEIEAVQLLAENEQELMAFVEVGQVPFEIIGPEEWIIHTLEGDMHVSPGDWIIRGVVGEFYPCKPEIFEQTYERVVLTQFEEARAIKIEFVRQYLGVDGVYSVGLGKIEDDFVIHVSVEDEMVADKLPAEFQGVMVTWRRGSRSIVALGNREDLE